MTPQQKKQYQTIQALCTQLEAKLTELDAVTDKLSGILTHAIAACSQDAQQTDLNSLKAAKSDDIKRAQLQLGSADERSELKLTSKHTTALSDIRLLCDALNNELSRISEVTHDATKSTAQGRLYKLTVYIPQSHIEVVKSAIFAAGAGHIGNYSHCCWQVLGTGQFMPQAGSWPHIGEQGILETVAEWRVECVVVSAAISKVIAALKATHPYETPAYDVIELDNVL